MFKSKALRLNLKDYLYKNRRLVLIMSATKMQLSTSDERHRLETKGFIDTFPTIVNEMINNPNYEDIPEVLTCFKDIMEYTIPNGNRTRALALVRSYKSLEDPRNLTPENIRLANILGWCLELLHGGSLILDDMLDNSKVRRGVKCWYKNEGVGSRAIVDAILLENYTNQLLKKHFSHLPMYLPALHLIQDGIIKSLLGEVLDSISKGSISNFTKSRFQTLTKYKTTPISFEVPYGLARCLANKFQTEIPLQTREMLIKLGEFFQAQNDFLDYCNGESKTGNDIEEGKCSWLVVVALEKANFKQRQLLGNHYGKKDPESVKIVRELYSNLEIPKVYAMYEEDTFNYINKNIDQVSKRFNSTSSQNDDKYSEDCTFEAAIRDSERTESDNQPRKIGLKKILNKKASSFLLPLGIMGKCNSNLIHCTSLVNVEMISKIAHLPIKPLVMFGNKVRLLNLKEYLCKSGTLVTVTNATKIRSFTSDQRHHLEEKQLMDAFPIVTEGFKNNPDYKDIPEVLTCFKDIAEHTVPTGKKTRAIALVRSYKSLEESKNLTPENIKLANILGWCLELLQTASLIVDDIVDDSLIRRGAKCWHKNEEVGWRAIVDATLLQNYTYELLKNHFSHLPMYAPALQLLQEGETKLALGEILDLISKYSDISNFTRDRFQTLTKYKTTSLAFELPYSLARCLSNKFRTEIPPQTREILIKLGEFFQIQNDFLDCYEYSSVGNKIGNDIEEGKLTWLIMVALEKANFEQKRLLENHYGKKDPESVKIVKQLYSTLEIPKAYATYEEDTFNYIEKNIDQVSKLTCHELMFKRLGPLH